MFKSLSIILILGLAIVLGCKPCKCPDKCPCPPDKKCPCCPDKKCPDCRPKDCKAQLIGGRGDTTEGGWTSPDGKTELKCDLPEKCRKHNIASKGLGCCVFRSADYLGHWQNEKDLFDLPEKMKEAGIAGGGYPEKFDQIMKKFAPNVKYINDTSGDPEILKAILASGRMAGVTYNGHDCHYSGSISHMVCLVNYDDKWAVVSDNNFTKSTEFVWMTPAEFNQRWKGGGGGWVVCLLKPPPPPVPHN